MRLVRLRKFSSFTKKELQEYNDIFYIPAAMIDLLKEGCDETIALDDEKYGSGYCGVYSDGAACRTIYFKGWMFPDRMFEEVFTGFWVD